MNKAPGGNNYYHHRKTKCPWHERVISIVAGLRKRTAYSFSKAVDAEQGARRPWGGLGVAFCTGAGPLLLAVAVLFVVERGLVEYVSSIQFLLRIENDGSFVTMGAAVQMLSEAQMAPLLQNRTMNIMLGRIMNVVLKTAREFYPC